MSTDRCLYSAAGTAHTPHEGVAIAALRAGDNDAYTRLVRDTEGMLRSAATRLLRDPSAAQDAVQDTFVSAYLSMHRFRGTSSLSTWLYRILMNICLTRLRQARRQPTLLHADGGRAEREPSRAPADDLDAMMHQRDLARLVHDEIDRLPPLMRTVLFLRDIHERETGEVARLCGTTTNAVKIRLHRARQALRASLAASAVSTDPRWAPHRDRRATAPSPPGRPRHG